MVYNTNEEENVKRCYIHYDIKPKMVAVLNNSLHQAWFEGFSVAGRFMIKVTRMCFNLLIRKIE
ncbi:hypothetical protein OUZ56_012384 [Daphnia magna]|uniref:Uncharacterized protein n=1 Tax=Daphnia magna TaxID=35525 RepID=A0ABQ9Z311_9CRUS|nr:hypothetical protein OUZ56_012384 [Daphnia magna]